MNNHQLSEKVKLLQKAVVVDSDRFLILKRADDAQTRPGKWDLPGGNAEWEHSPIDVKNPHKIDLIREIAEETGLQVEPESIGSNEICYAGTYYEAAKHERSEVFTVILGWKINLGGVADREIKISDEHSESAWIGLNQFDEYDFGFAGEKDGFIRQMVFNALNS